MHTKHLVGLTLVVTWIVGLLVWVPPSFADPAEMSVSEVYETGTNILVPGASSMLVRTDSGASMTLDTHSLAPGAYTVWFVYFNDPSQCISAPNVAGTTCGGADIMNNSPAGADFVQAAGHIIGENGNGNFAGHIKVGDVGIVNGVPLTDSRNAEFHIVVRTHGEKIPGVANQQISSLNGGCPPNTCTNVQVAIHP